MTLDRYLIKKKVEKRELSSSRKAKKIEGITSKPEVPANLPPSYLVSAVYDGKKGCVALKLYEPNSQKIYLWYDNTGHKPYFLSNLSISQLRGMSEVTSHGSFEKFEAVKKRDLLNDKEVTMTKIVVADPLAVGGRSGLRKVLPHAWEADIKYYTNYLYDRKLVPCLLYEVKNGDLKKAKDPISKEEVEKILALFKDEEGVFKEYIARWIPLLECPVPDFRRVALDIEVYSPSVERMPDPRTAEYPVICASFVGSDGLRSVLVLKRENFGGEEYVPGVQVEYYDSERELLREIFKVLSEYPFIITFNGDEFDLSYLWHRALRRGFSREEIPIVLSRVMALSKYGVHIDLVKFFFNKSIQVYAFGQKYREVALNDVGKALVGMEKIELKKPISEIGYRELIEYCLRDAEIAYQLTNMKGGLVMKLIAMLSRIAMMPMDDVSRLGVSNWIKSAMNFEHRRMGALIPRSGDLMELKGVTTTKAVIKGKKYKGAIVMEPTPGVHFNVRVLDFASLYPSIIKRWNLSYETVMCTHSECKDNTLPGTSYWVCKRRGISSLIIGSLKELRVRWYKPKSRDKSLSTEKREFYEVVQQALKVILNASYGVFGAEHFELYCPPVAESTAAIGRHVMTETLKQAKQMGIGVIYGDTDSIFLKEPGEERVERLIGWAKQRLGLDLEMDKSYRYVVFSSLKKNYLGVYPDGGVDIKGLIGKKRHMPEFVRKAFYEMVKTLEEVHSEEDFKVAKEKIRNIVKEAYQKLKKGEYPLDDLAISIMLRKFPEEYKEVMPQHVRAALSLMEKGVELKPGDVVTFVKVKGPEGVKPLQLTSKEEVDVEKYISYLETAFNQVLDALGLDFHTIIGFTKLEAFL
jgi:DNA polymerase I